MRFRVISKAATGEGGSITDSLRALFQRKKPIRITDWFIWIVEVGDGKGLSAQRNGARILRARLLLW
jgi:hypothetical protein